MLDDRLLDQIEALEPLPITAQRLITVLADEDVSFQQIVEIVEHDPAVASNLMRLANSPIYGGRFRIERLRDAVVRLGAMPLLDIALGGFLRKLGSSAPLYDLPEDELWLHSAVASLATQEVARVAHVAVPATAGIAALVHDIGKLIMSRYSRAEARTVVDACIERNLTFIEAERALLGCDHAEIGGAVARRWGFPAAVIEAIEGHHDCPIAAGAVVLDVVVTANFAAKTIGVGLGAEGLNLKIDQGCLRRLEIDFDGFCAICARTASRTVELKKAYGLA